MEQPQSSSKREKVLEALAAGKSSAEAAAQAGCTIQYVYGIVKKQKESVTVSLDETREAEELRIQECRQSALKTEGPGLVQTTGVASPCVAEPIGRGIVAERIWPTIVEKVARRLRRNDERFEVAAKDAFEAADCFFVKARGHDDYVASTALIIWPSIWRDYQNRGVMKNTELASESAEQALNAAKAFLSHGEPS